MAKARWKETENLIREAREILEPEHPMTIRQLFYRLVSIQVLQNNLPNYKRVSRVMTDVRKVFEIPFDWIVDRTKVEIEPLVWDDPGEFSELVGNLYKKNRWQDQSCHVEIWSEKDAINGSVEPVYSRYGVTFRAYRGFNSTTKKYEIARFFNSLGKPVVILYLGDHDPSGWAIQRDLKNALNEYHVHDFTISRLAIMPEDIHIFNLPPLRVKEKDSRAPKFKARYGEEAVELDALPPTELRARLEDAILELIDVELWNRAESVEQVELESIREIADKIKEWQLK